MIGLLSYVCRICDKDELTASDPSVHQKLQPCRLPWLCQAPTRPRCFPLQRFQLLAGVAVERSTNGSLLPVARRRQLLPRPWCELAPGLLEAFPSSRLQQESDQGKRGAWPGRQTIQAGSGRL